MTVYRTSDDSALVPSLIEAAERGKQAVCLVELKARFDERRNIGWARSLEEAGAHVVHGLPGLKTHAKALLVVRREGSGRAPLRARRHRQLPRQDRPPVRGLRPVHHRPSRSPPTWPSCSTRSPAPRARPSYRKAIVAPERHARLVPRPGARARSRRTRRARRRASCIKLNSLVDARCIRALYEASQAGVQVDLNVRGICCLRAGVPGVSENIRVVSVVGRFLEHSRVYGFWRGDERLYWMGSADLMPRNLDTRVELLAPIEDAGPARRDRGHARALPGRRHVRLGAAARTTTWERRRGGKRSAHRELMERALERAAASAGARAAAPSFSASTRAAERRIALAERRSSARASRSSQGCTSFQLALPVIRIRSAPGPDRALRGAGPRPERSSTAWASMLSVTITPSKPSRSRSSPVTTRGDCEAIRRAVERRVERVREHHERHAGVDGGAERDQVALARRRARAPRRRRCSPGRGPARGSASRWRPRRAAVMPSTAARVRAAMPRASPAKARKPITGAAPPGTSATGARFTFTPAPRSCRAAARAPRRTAAGSPCGGWPAGRPGPADGADLAALLVDHHERLAAGGALHRARSAPRHASRGPALKPNMITPAVSPARRRRRT